LSILYTLTVFNVHVGRFPLSVSNTYSFTKVFLNDNILEINLFRERLVYIIFLILVVIVLSNSNTQSFFELCYSIPKDEQLVSSSQILCTHSYSGLQVANEDDLLSKNTVLPLSQVIQLDQVCVNITWIPHGF